MLAFVRPVTWGFAAVWALGLQVVTIAVSVSALGSWHLEQARNAMLGVALVVTVVVALVARVGKRRAARRGR